MIAEELVRRAIAATSALWPGISVDASGFSGHLANLSVADPDLEARGAELALCYACLRGDAVALRILERDYLSKIAPAIARVNRSDEFVDEIRQAVRERLLMGEAPRLGRYSASGALGAWLRVLAMRVALDQVRKQPPRGEKLLQVLAEPFTSAPSEGGAYRETVLTALREAFGTLSSREKNVLRLQYLDAHSIDQIGVLYGVHRATVARWLARGREKIFGFVAYRVRSELSLTDSDVRSVIAKVQSQLDASVARLLNAEGSREMAG